MTEYPTVPGSNRPKLAGMPNQYDRRAVEHVLAVKHWLGWNEMLAWLRSTGIADPALTPDELRGFRQDAERAQALSLPFSNDAEMMCGILQQANNHAARAEPS